MSPLIQLRELHAYIGDAINVLEKECSEHNDPMVDVHSTEVHPRITRILSEEVGNAEKTIFGAATMLQASLNPRTVLRDKILSYHITNALQVVNAKGVAKILGTGKVSAKDLAGATGINPDKLTRIMRLLCSNLIFCKVEDDVYANNAVSILLASDEAQALVGHCLEDVNPVGVSGLYEALTKVDLKDSFALSASPFAITKRTELSVFDYWKRHEPHAFYRFPKAMSAHAEYDGFAAAKAFPFADMSGGVIVDVGGSLGQTSRLFLEENSKIQLVLEDMEPVVRAAEEHWTVNHPDLISRVTFQPCDFFKTQPVKGADVYYLQNIIHDWTDEDCVKILENLRDAMTTESRLIIAGVVPPSLTKGPAPRPLLPNYSESFAFCSDLQMLYMCNSRERTAADLDRLMNPLGVKVVKEWKNSGSFTLTECMFVN
ncbi:S-adenosyl-L-methionine-dependent methyltransferase [Saitoella complicata NRRL Y-17804]|uniref:S-adenosyl-L-methionine-dependent methyltransferase n=1 Tax=Saitoella complicata (strain BCRC 22490 / CBS 7301 / JCM 7358 / NBRC 10748 / NRRL Y-17804) TaxID=698492 RepID=UPI000868069E|nr:S-adenosyl-L-methionine-dependent methyltransferase [Saitoella complicata NRRL Y-17804]ODQ51087.1 S-adenosyl-L-methionine-dependent methyltransferase [Saitoella complicata NRRL Y-17804]